MALNLHPADLSDIEKIGTSGTKRKHVDVSVRFLCGAQIDLPSARHRLTSLSPHAIVQIAGRYHDQNPIGRNCCDSVVCLRRDIANDAW